MTSTGVLNPLEIGALVTAVEQGRLLEAEARARELLKSHPRAGHLWKILSVALLRQGKDAGDALQQAAQLLPHDAETQRNLGAALQDQGRWEAALASFRQALILEPANPDTLFEAANVLRELEKPGEAVPLYQRALAQQPGMLEAHNNLGNAFLELRQYADAAGCYRLALRASPDNPRIHCNLATAQRLLGYLDEAFESVRRSLSLDPASSPAQNQLGMILTARGLRKEAIASYRQAVLLDPGSVQALDNLGSALRDIGSRREALAVLAKSVAMNALRPESHCSLGAVLFEIRRVDEAAACHRHALSLRPDYAPAHLNLGFALRQQRRAAEAETSCRTALELDPSNVEAFCLLGELHADRGLFTEAERLFDQAIDIDPRCGAAFCSIATHRKMTLADSRWLSGVQTALAASVPLAQEIALYFALGKYFDDVQLYDEAFQHYRRANELTKRYGAVYNAQEFSARIDELIRSDLHASAGVRRASSGSELPIFIVGMPRSGTSLVEQILASHPDVHGAGEIPYWGAAHEEYRRSQRSSGPSSPPPADLSAKYLDYLVSVAGSAKRVIDKLPANVLYLGFIHAALPNARFIHVRRHPIDTCLSIYFQNFFNIGPFANDLNDLSHYYSEYRRVSAHYRQSLPASNYLEVPYESLVADQELWTRRMLDFIGVPWDAGCLDFHRTERVVLTASKWQVRQIIHSASSGRWKNYEKHLGALRRLAQDTAPPVCVPCP